MDTGATSRLILFNKPFGVLSQFTDTGMPDAPRTLSAFLSIPGIYAAGRLANDSEGLLILTDDGPLQVRIADPRFKLPKTYFVQVEGRPGDGDLGPLRRGISLKDGSTRPAAVELIDPSRIWQRDPPIRFRRGISASWLSVTIREGRNRQVRRITAAVGYPTLRLVRLSIGDWTVVGLAPENAGKCRCQAAQRG